MKTCEECNWAEPTKMYSTYCICSVKQEFVHINKAKDCECFDNSPFDGSLDSTRAKLQKVYDAYWSRSRK
jgi:hypothetical protein